MDEIDTVFGPKAKENEEIRALLNAGHRKGAVAGRCVVRGRTVETEEIPAYAAVALAGLGWLPDTILSRSIIIRMRRRHAGEQVQPFRRRIHATQGHRIRDAIEARAASLSGSRNSRTRFRTAMRTYGSPSSWWADAAGGDWPARARAAAVALVAAAKEAEPSLGVRLLGDLRATFGEADQLSTEAVLKVLCGMEEAPWGDLKGKPLDSRGLARRLREYGVKPRTLRVGGATPKGYRREDLHDAWSRYLLLSPEKSATNATFATSSDLLGENVADQKKCCR